MKLGRGVEITWLGHSTFRLVSPGGKVLLIDPWTEGNPACPDAYTRIDNVDIMLITHAHDDHMSDAVPIARAAQPELVVAMHEICLYLEGQGVDGCSGMNKGGTQTHAGISITQVHADHSSGLNRDGTVVSGGEPCGYVIEFENGFTLYHAGDTNVFGDMRLIGQLYRPDVACLPIGDHFTMGPREAALACRLLEVPRVIPMHFGTFPILTGTPAALREQLGDQAGVEVLELTPGETLR